MNELKELFEVKFGFMCQKLDDIKDGIKDLHIKDEKQDEKISNNTTKLEGQNSNIKILNKVIIGLSCSAFIVIIGAVLKYFVI